MTSPVRRGARRLLNDAPRCWFTRESLCAEPRGGLSRKLLHLGASRRTVSMNDVLAALRDLSRKQVQARLRVAVAGVVRNTASSNLISNGLGSRRSHPHATPHRRCDVTVVVGRDEDNRKIDTVGCQCCCRSGRSCPRARRRAPGRRPGGLRGTQNSSAEAKPWF